MSDNFNWSTNIGRWIGIPVRIHLFLFLFVAIVFGAEWNPGSANSNMFAATAMVTVIVFLASILLHEFAHAFALANLGGHVNNVVLMPWGGISDWSLPQAGYSRALVYAAGPFANGVVFLLGSALLIQSEHSTMSQLVNPFDPHWFDGGQWPVSLITIVTWVNFQIAFINLIPCYPFDGAGIVRSLIAEMKFDVPQYRVESAINLIGNSVAFGLIGIAWLCRSYDGGSVHPAWLVMLLCGITLFFSAAYSMHLETQQDPNWDDFDDMEYGSLYDETSFFDFTEDNENVSYSQWLQEKQDARRAHELHAEEEEDRLADDILKKLHTHGITSLTPDERSLLDRVSIRIRRRREQGV